MTSRHYYRLGIGVAFVSVAFLILAVGALGIIGDGGREDRLYLAVPVVAAVGSIGVRLRSPGMSLVLLATALTQVVVTVCAFLAGYHRTDGASVVDILGVNAMYVALFGLAAWLFWRAGHGAFTSNTIS